MDTSFLLRLGNKIPMEGVTETKFGEKLFYHLEFSFLLKYQKSDGEPGVVAHAFNPSPWEAEAGGKDLYQSYI